MAAPEIFCGGGASRGQNAILRGQKSKNLPKMTDFGHFFSSDWGASGGGEPPTGGGGIFPHAPLDAATAENIQKYGPVLFDSPYIIT